MKISKLLRLSAILLGSILAVTLITFSTLHVSPKHDDGQGRVYYISPAGSDQNTGLSAEKPWRTLSRVNSKTFHRGDMILFQGGEKFTGSLRIRGHGHSNQPITFSSYGPGIATIDSKQEVGAIVTSPYVKISRLNFRGEPSRNGSHFGILLKNNTNSQISGIQLDRLDISNYGEHGILIKGKENANHGFSHLNLTNIRSHDNRGDGIRAEGSWNRQGKIYSHDHFHISDCKMYNNSGYDSRDSSGNGLVLSDVDGAVVEYCEAYNNGFGWGGRGGGPVGIWSWDSNNVVIQHSESHHNKNGAGSYDGGGFDIDGGDTNSVVQYCYSHDNAGPGYFLAHFPNSSATTNNIIRYNISENDAQNTIQGAMNIWSAGSKELTENWVYNNVVAGNRYTTAVFMRESSGPSITVANNVFISAKGATLLRSDVSADILYRRNLYWSPDGNLEIRWGGSSYKNVDTWSSASGQELYNGQVTGLHLDPRLESPGNGLTIGDPHRLANLRAYKALPESPLINTAINLKALFGHHPGNQDFYGNSIPEGNDYDVGVHESPSSHPVQLSQGLVTISAPT